MFKQMINKWFNSKNTTNEDFGNATIDMARSNYKEYKQKIKNQQQNYLEMLCEDIKSAAKSGKLSTTTYGVKSEDFMTDDFLQELHTYFTSRGFKVKEEPYMWNYYRPCLRISWEEVADDE